MPRPPECSDCGSSMEPWGDCWRCPWSKASGASVRNHAAGRRVSCGRPYSAPMGDAYTPGRKTK